MLAYLDALLAALTAGGTAEIERLLAHPLARVLTREATVEVRTALAAPTAAAAPLRLLQLRHQTAQLLGESGADEAVTRAPLAPPSTTRVAERRTSRHQIELPLSA
jgi:hypothetical protein